MALGHSETQPIAWLRDIVRESSMFPVGKLADILTVEDLAILKGSGLANFGPEGNLLELTLLAVAPSNYRNYDPENPQLQAKIEELATTLVTELLRTVVPKK